MLLPSLALLLAPAAPFALPGEGTPDPPAEPAPLRVYLNADLTYNTASGRSIELGLRTALDGLGGSIGGQYVELVVLDHRANARRSSHNIARAAADAQTLAVFGGMHSPPLLAERPTIHDEELLVLVPWAAAGPITRSGSEPNWIFRLSVDDTKAGSVLAGHAVEVEGSSAPHLVLERTGWGRSNEGTIRASLLERGIEDPVVHWIDWGIGDKHAEQLARK
ncbi:MAG: ABC transporter substrate-binding protein, partial [Planctomycetota bacterium]